MADEATAVVEEKKIYSCDVCGKTFNWGGARNGHQGWCRKKKAAEKAAIPKKEELVEIEVRPSISINGKTYAGRMKVTPAKAATLIWMMQQHRKNEADIPRSVVHKDKHLGSV